MPSVSYTTIGASLAAVVLFNNPVSFLTLLIGFGLGVGFCAYCCGCMAMEKLGSFKKQCCECLSSFGGLASAGGFQQLFPKKDINVSGDLDKLFGALMNLKPLGDKLGPIESKPVESGPVKVAPPAENTIKDVPVMNSAPKESVVPLPQVSPEAKVEDSIPKLPVSRESK